MPERNDGVHRSGRAVKATALFPQKVEPDRSWRPSSSRLVKSSIKDNKKAREPERNDGVHRVPVREGTIPRPVEKK